MTAARPAAVDAERGAGTNGDVPIAVPGGLDGVTVGETAVGDVRGEEGFYHYRQFSAVDLATTRSLEDVAHLLLKGTLPDLVARQAFCRQVAASRELPPGFWSMLPAIARVGPPLQTLRTAISLVGSELGWPPTRDLGHSALEEEIVRLWAMVPTVIAAAERSRRGLPPVHPRADLGTTANYLWMLEGAEPDPHRTGALEQYLVTTADHGFNASTFAARVITSTGSDLASAMCGAIGALAGPLHGGAPSRVLDMLDDISDPARAAQWVRDAVARGDRIMGFGHRIYRTDDPRAVLMRQVAVQLGGPVVELATEVERAVVTTLGELKPGRRIYTNVEFYTAVVLALCGIPRELFTPTFAASRTLGWSAHILEQAAANHLIRPATRYVGPRAPQPVPAQP